MLMTTIIFRRRLGKISLSSNYPRRIITRPLIRLHPCIKRMATYRTWHLKRHPSTARLRCVAAIWQINCDYYRVLYLYDRIQFYFNSFSFLMKRTFPNTTFTLSLLSQQKKTTWLIFKYSQLDILLA